MSMFSHTILQKIEFYFSIFSRIKEEWNRFFEFYFNIFLFLVWFALFAVRQPYQMNKYGHRTSHKTHACGDSWKRSNIIHISFHRHHHNRWQIIVEQIYPTINCCHGSSYFSCFVNHSWGSGNEKVHRNQMEDSIWIEFNSFMNSSKKKSSKLIKYIRNNEIDNRINSM